MNQPAPMKCQKLVDELVAHGMTAVYCTESTYRAHITNLDTNMVLVYIHGSGEDVILLGDNEIDTIRFKFRPGRRDIRVRQ